MSVNRVQIMYAEIREQLPQRLWEAQFRRLDPRAQAKVSGFRRWQDAHAALIGRLMVASAFGLGDGPLQAWTETEFRRPSLPGYPDFNLSHTEGCVALAWCTHGRIGLDVERYRVFEFNDARDVFTDHEWADIEGSADRPRRFFEWWTLKEAVMKADGRGFYLHPTRIRVEADMAFVDQDRWCLQPFVLGTEVMAHFATEIRAQHFEVLTFQI